MVRLIRTFLIACFVNFSLHINTQTDHIGVGIYTSVRVLSVGSGRICMQLLLLVYARVKKVKYLEYSTRSHTKRYRFSTGKMCTCQVEKYTRIAYSLHDIFMKLYVEQLLIKESNLYFNIGKFKLCIYQRLLIQHK